MENDIPAASQQPVTGDQKRGSNVHVRTGSRNTLVTSKNSAEQQIPNATSAAVGKQPDSKAKLESKVDADQKLSKKEKRDSKADVTLQKSADKSDAKKKRSSKADTALQQSKEQVDKNDKHDSMMDKSLAKTIENPDSKTKHKSQVDVVFQKAVEPHHTKAKRESKTSTVLANDKTELSESVDETANASNRKNSKALSATQAKDNVKMEGGPKPAEQSDAKPVSSRVAAASQERKSSKAAALVTDSTLPDIKTGQPKFELAALQDDSVSKKPLDAKAKVDEPVRKSSKASAASTVAATIAVAQQNSKDPTLPSPLMTKGSEKPAGASMDTEGSHSSRKSLTKHLPKSPEGTRKLSSTVAAPPTDAVVSATAAPAPSQQTNVGSQGQMAMTGEAGKHRRNTKASKGEGKKSSLKGTAPPGISEGGAGTQPNVAPPQSVPRHDVG
jgi:hypothetical protein